MTPDSHRIQRQVIELELAAGMPAAESQERLAREMRDHVMPALCAAFDAAAGPHELLRLDRLEVDLGTLSGSDWLPRFGERLVSHITRELARYVPEATPRPADAGPHASSADAMRQFLFFLEHGRLPWWGARDVRFLAAFAPGRFSLDWRALRGRLCDDARARERLVDTLDDAQLAAGVQQWCGVPHSAQALAVWTPAAVASGPARAWRRRFWLTLVDAALRGEAQLGREAGLVRALRAARHAVFGDEAASSGTRSSPAAAPAGPQDASRSTDAMPSPWNVWLDAAPDRVADPTAPDALDEPDRTPRKQPARAAHDPAPHRRASPPEAAEPIYLPCAGIVLLHPFLEALFRDRGLLAGREFRSAVARSHAVHLVGLLGFGVVDIPEHDLVLAKRLCGHPLPDTLVPPDLDAGDIAACDELINAVLGHWKALRSSSPQWLRTQFFLREGKLESVDGGCRLTVERRAQDVLLTRLPWGIGVIGLPWNAEKIFVRWLD